MSTAGVVMRAAALLKIHAPRPKVAASKNFGVVESVKAVSDLFAPVSGEVVEVNGELAQKPEIVNQDPYGKGWMLVVKPSSKGEWDQLLTAQQYEELIAQGGH